MINGEKTLRHLLAPVQDVLDDPTVTEIVIQRPGEIGIERGGKWVWRRCQSLRSGASMPLAFWPGRCCQSGLIRSTRSA